MKKYITFSFLLKCIIALILLQTLYFKFSAAPESVYIFEQVGMEPWGRIASGIVELTAAILLFVPSLTWLGCLLALGTICGAIFFHLTKLGIVVMDDGGLLFILACIVFICSTILLWMNRGKIPFLGQKLVRSQA